MIRAMTAVAGFQAEGVLKIQMSKFECQIKVK
jgi:hypothetical protein